MLCFFTPLQKPVGGSGFTTSLNCFGTSAISTKNLANGCNITASGKKHMIYDPTVFAHRTLYQKCAKLLYTQTELH